jgi:hypothetical protein
MRQRTGRDGQGGADGDDGGEPDPHDGRILAAAAPRRSAAEPLSGANGLTRFVKGDHRYRVTVRFQLPDEPPECPAAPA